MAENEKAANEAQDDFEIKTELEFLIQAGRDNKVSLGTIFQCLLRSPVYMVLNREVKPGDPLNDVQGLMVQDDDGSQMLTVFTGEERTRQFQGKHPGYEHPTRFPAPILLDNMHDKMGLIINPGLSVGMQVTAEGVNTLKREFGKGWLQHIPEGENRPEDKSGRID